MSNLLLEKGKMSYVSIKFTIDLASHVLRKLLGTMFTVSVVWINPFLAFTPILNPLKTGKYWEIGFLQSFFIFQSQLISLSTKTIDRSTTEDTPVAVMAADLYGRLLKNSNEISQNDDVELQARSSSDKNQSSYQVEVEVAVKIKKRNEHDKKETSKRKRTKKTVDLKQDNKSQIKSKKQRTWETFAEESDGCTVSVENRSIEERGKATVTEARISVKATK